MTKRVKKMVLWIVIGLQLLSIGIFFSMPVIFMNPMINKHIHFNEIWTSEEYGLQAEHFFVKTDDGINISVYEVEVDNPSAVLICLSGIHNPSTTIYFGHARLFSDHQFATIMVDMRAHGESAGDRICLGYKEWLDVQAVVQYIKEKPLYNNIPVIVLGLSMGAATAINAIGEIPELDGLISISAYSSWEDVFYDQMETMVPKIIARIEKPFVSLVTFIKFGTKSLSVQPKKEITKLGNRPALLMHSKDDAQVPFVNLERLLSYAPSHVETFIREGDNHFFTEHFENPKEDTEYAERVIEFIHKIIHQHKENKMNRTLIKIDKERCTGCGACVQGCHGGALQLIDGKAVIINEHYCDGLGVCLGECPVGAISQVQISELKQFPVQLHLLNPRAPFLQGADLLLAADCTAFASGDFHSRFLKGKTLAIACPKLDNKAQVYVDKLIAMIDDAQLRSLTVLIMEVPCCKGLAQIAQTACQQAKRKIPLTVTKLSTKGEVVVTK
jgi:ferredoxin